MATIVAFSPGYGQHVIESALVQQCLFEKVESTDDRTIFRAAPQPEKGYHWPFLLMSSSCLDKSKPALIFVETVNTGRVSNSYRFHEEQALNRLRRIRHEDGAFQDRFVWCMPVFVRPAAQPRLYTHALDRDSLLVDTVPFTRIDLQVLAMVESAKAFLASDCDVSTCGKFAIGGFSASGEFAQRFSVLHPEALAFVVAGGIGGLPVLPIEIKDGQRLEYPIGVADVNELIGRSVDLEALARLPRLLYFGSEDTNDPVKYDDAYTPAEREVVFSVLGSDPRKRWLRCIEIYQQFPSSTVTYVDEGVGHATSERMRLTIQEFMRENTERQLRENQTAQPGATDNPDDAQRN